MVTDELVAPEATASLAAVNTLPPYNPAHEALWRAYRRHAGFGWCETCEQVAPCLSWTNIRRELVKAGVLLALVAIKDAHHTGLATQVASQS
jgi:hypothetical protein